MQEISNKTNRLVHVEELRGIAILFILLFHMWPKGISMGFLGVDVFLVITGYFLFVKPIFKDNGEGLISSCNRFLKKKLLRIFVPLAFIVALTLLVDFFVYPEENLATAAKTGLASLFGCSNVYLSYVGDQYFAESEEFNPFVPTWYLSITFQVYLLFLLGSFLLRRCARWVLFTLLALVSVASYFYSHFAVLEALLQHLGFGGTGVGLAYTRAYYYTTGRVWEIVMGGAILIMPGVKNPVVKRILGLSGLAVVVACMGQNICSSGCALSTVVVMGTMLFIKYGDACLLGKYAVEKLFHFLGKISFSLYLVHVPLITVFCLVLGDLGYCVQLILLLLIVGLAFVFNRYVESKAFPSWVNLGSWSGALLLCSGAVFGTPNSFIWEQYKPDSGWKPNDLDMIREGRFYEGFDTSCLLYSSHVQYIGQIDNYRDAHFIGMGDVEKANFVLLGDSHAAAWFFGFRELCERHDIGGIYLTSYIIPLHGWRNITHLEDQRNFAEKEDATMHWLESHPEIKTVVIGQRFHAKFHLYKYEREPQAPETVALALREYVKRLNAIGKKVIILSHVPQIHSQNPRLDYMLSQRYSNKVAGQRLHGTWADYQQENAECNEALLKMEQEGLCQVLRIENDFFQDGVFSPLKGNSLMMYDANHLSPAGAKHIIMLHADELRAWLQSEAPDSK